jgi:hypothetical protein
MFEHDALVARAKLRHIDLSNLPFRMSVSLTKVRDIPDPLKPVSTTGFAIKLVADVKCVVTGNMTYYTSYVGLEWGQDLNAKVFGFLLRFCEHEFRENFVVDGERPFNPHK